MFNFFKRFAPKKYIEVKEKCVGVRIHSDVLGKPATWIPVHIDEANLNSVGARSRVLRKDEIAAVTETGQFKVGDGVTPFDKLPWATRLPVIEQTRLKEVL